MPSPTDLPEGFVILGKERGPYFIRVCQAWIKGEGLKPYLIREGEFIDHEVDDVLFIGDCTLKMCKHEGLYMRSVRLEASGPIAIR